MDTRSLHQRYEYGNFIDDRKQDTYYKITIWISLRQFNFQGLIELLSTDMSRRSQLSIKQPFNTTQQSC